MYAVTHLTHAPIGVHCLQVGVEEAGLCGRWLALVRDVEGDSGLYLCTESV